MQVLFSQSVQFFAKNRLQCRKRERKDGIQTDAVLKGYYFR